MNEEQRNTQVQITKTIIGQILAHDSNILEKIECKGISPMTESKNQRGGALIHLPNNRKIEIRLTWADLYDVKYYVNVKSNMVVEDNGNLNYEGSGNCVYSLDGCYFDMLANVINTALKDSPKREFNTLSMFKDLNNKFNLN